MTGGRRIAAGAAALGVAGLLVCGVGALVDPGAVLRGWLAGFAFWIGLPVGAVLLLLAHQLTGGRWGEAAGVPLRAAAATMPLLAVLYVPVLLWLPGVYPWARPEVAEHLKNTFYLNVPFFTGRAVVFLGLWLLLALLAGRRSGAGALAAPALIAMGTTATFASFDWTMSIEPEWGSSIYGMIAISGHLLAALVLATLAAVATGAADAGQRRDLGSLLIAGILLWFYLSFMQFLIVWEEDLPHEIPWYVRRLDGGWGWVAALGALGQGLLPFLALVLPQVKRSRAGLGAVCALLLATHMVECWWLVLPGMEGGFTWFAPAATAGMGGLWALLFLWRLRAARHGVTAMAADGAIPEGARHG